MITMQKNKTNLQGKISNLVDELKESEQSFVIITGKNGSSNHYIDGNRMELYFMIKAMMDKDYQFRDLIKSLNN